MKKFALLCICGAVAAAVLTGCSGSDKLAQYKGVEVYVASREVSEGEVYAKVKEIMDANPNYVEVDRPAKEGDIVNIDYVGTQDGVEFAGGTGDGVDLTLGSNRFIEGFESGLIGTKKGDHKVLNLTFPENYQSEELAGQDVVFEVTVNEVAEKHTPELTEAFVAENFPDLGTVDAYKEDLRQQMLDSKQQQSDQQRNAELLSAIVEDSEITCATEDVDEIYDQQINYYTTMASLYGLELADYASVMGMDEDTFRTEVRNIAELTVKQNMVLDEVAKKEGLKVEDADRQALAEEYKDVYESVDDMIEQAGAENVDRAILSEKALQVIVDNADITTVDGIDVAE